MEPPRTESGAVRLERTDTQRVRGSRHVVGRLAGLVQFAMDDRGCFKSGIGINRLCNRDSHGYIWGRSCIDIELMVTARVCTRIWWLSASVVVGPTVLDIICSISLSSAIRDLRRLLPLARGTCGKVSSRVLTVWTL